MKLKVGSGERRLVYDDEQPNQALACHGVRPALSRSEVPSLEADEGGTLMNTVSFWIWGSAERFVIASRNTYYSGSPLHDVN